MVLELMLANGESRLWKKCLAPKIIDVRQVLIPLTFTHAHTAAVGPARAGPGLGLGDVLFFSRRN
jgi:hypothetical protein